MNPPIDKPNPRAIIIAGPNGAGKTTFACEFLPAEGRCSTFINADLIAAGLSPLEPDKANITAMWQIYDAMRTPPVLIDEGGEA